MLFKHLSYSSVDFQKNSLTYATVLMRGVESVLYGSQSTRSSSTEGTATSGNPTEVNGRNGNIRQEYKTDYTANPVTSNDTHAEPAKSHSWTRTATQLRKKSRILDKHYFTWDLITAQSCSFTFLIVIAHYKAEVKFPEYTKKL